MIKEILSKLANNGIKMVRIDETRYAMNITFLGPNSSDRYAPGILDMIINAKIGLR